MMKNFIASMLFLYSVTLFAAIGEPFSLNIKNLPLAPDAIVMKDAAGEEAIVVFYRLLGDNQDIGFKIGKEDTSGALLWSENYKLKTSALRASGFSPAPVMFNGKLYLFGRYTVPYEKEKKKNHRYIIYNYFDTLEDLKAHATGSDGQRNFKYLGIETRKDNSHFAVTTESANLDTDDHLLIAFYEKDGEQYGTLSSSRCSPDESGALSCNAVSIQNNMAHEKPPTLLTLTFPTSKEAVLLMPSDKSLIIQHYNHTETKWDKPNNAGTAAFSGKYIDDEVPLGAVSVDDTLQLYYGKHGASSATAISEDLWASTVKWRNAAGTSDSYINTNKTIKPIVYKGHVYLFYIHQPPEDLASCWEYNGSWYCDPPEPAELYGMEVETH